ncbi:acyl-CoA dehydrogenase family protein [Flavobacteriaceae bacterium 3-367]
MSSTALSQLPQKEQDPLEKVYQSLRTVERTKDYKDFYSYLKSTRIPFIPCDERKAGTMYRECFKVLHGMGQISIPVAVALSMHYYMLAALAAYPLSKKSTSYWKREMLLAKIKKERLLIANTGSVRTFKDTAENSGILARKEKGYYTIQGKAPFMSLAGVADYVVFAAELPSGEKAVFFVPLDNDQIEFEHTAFGDSMQGSFTKAVKFKNLRVGHANVLSLPDSQASNCEILVYQRAWFQALIPAPYLGATSEVLSCAKAFAKKKIKNGKSLAASENFQGRVGELLIKYRAAQQLCEHTGAAMDDFKRGDRISLKKLFESSVLSKHFSTHFAEEIVTQVRYLMGSQFLLPGTLTNKVYKEIVFGALQPMSDTDIKDYFARAFMDPCKLSF